MVYVFLCVVGLIVGSFLGAVAYRIPRGLSIVRPPSACPACGRRLGAADLVPVLSHIVSRARCRHCGASVSWRYTVVELLTAGGFVALYALTVDVYGFGWQPLVVGAFLYAVLLVMAVIDLEHMILPDVINLFAAGVGIVFSLLGWSGVAWSTALFGAALGYGIIFVIHWLTRGGMGLGDAKFLAAIGTFVGPTGVLYTLFAASVLGSIVGGALMIAGRHKPRTRIPFGPFLAAAAFGLWSWHMFFK